MDIRRKSIALMSGRPSDTTAPTVTITSTESNGTYSNPIPITITFSETVIGFAVGDITAGNCTLSGFAGSGAVYTVNAAPTAAAVTIDIAGGVCTDAAGNGNTAATQFAITSGFMGMAIWAQSSSAATLFQDTGKTTPAASANDPVGAWADKSGNGNDLTSALGDTYRPLLKLSVLNGKNALLPDGSNDNLQKTSFFDSTWNKACSGLIITNRSDYTTAGNYCPFGTDSNFYMREVNANGIEIRHGGAGINVTARSNHCTTGGTKRHITAFSYDGTILWIRTNRFTRGFFTNTNWTMGTTLAFGSLAAATFPYNTHLFEGIFYKSGLTEASVNKLFTYGAAQLGLTIPTVTRRIVFVGDSLTWGTGATSAYVSWADVFMAALNSDGLYSYNFGTPGYLATNIAGTALQTHIASVCNSSTIAFVWLGTNDLKADRTAAQVWTDLTTICNAIRATGAKVILSTVIARGNLSAGQETARGTLNTNIATNFATIADYLLDLAADARFQNASDTTYYNADTIHLNDAGYGVVKDLATTVYNTI